MAGGVVLGGRQAPSLRIDANHLELRNNSHSLQNSTIEKEKVQFALKQPNIVRRAVSEIGFKRVDKDRQGVISKILGRESQLCTSDGFCVKYRGSLFKNRQVY